MAAGPEPAEGTFRSVKLGRAKGKAEGREGGAGEVGGELWLIGQEAADAASPLVDTRAGAGRRATPGSTSQARVLALDLAVKTPAESLGLG